MRRLRLLRARARTTFALSAVVGSSVSAAAGAQPARAAWPEVLASEVRLTGVTTYDGRVVWSSFDPASGRYFLMSWSEGRSERLPVRPRAVPFDADLGPGPDGSVNVVYSRCAQEPPGADRSELLPPYARGERCRLWRYSFAARQERRIRRTANVASEFLPSIWGDRVAFVDRTGPAGERPSLQTHIRSLDARKPDRLVPIRRTHFARGAESADIVRLDLRGKRLLSAWDYGGVRCRRDPPGEFRTTPSASEIFVGNASGIERIVRACDYDRVRAAFGPGWVGAQVVAVVDLQTQAPRRLQRVRRQFIADGEVAGDEAAAGGFIAFAPGPRADFGVVLTASAFTPSGMPEYYVVRAARPSG